MSVNLKRSLLVSLVLILSLFMIAAAPLPFQESPPSDILVYVQLATAAFAALVGWPALLSSIVAALEYFGWLSISAADTFMFWSNVVVFGGIFVAALLGKIDLVNVVDATFGTVAQLLIYILIILGVPLGFERAKGSEEKIRSSRFFQARVLSRAK